MTVRTGMTYLVTRLSALTNAGEEFTQDELQDVLDNNRMFYEYVLLHPSPTRLYGGAVVYRNYYLPNSIGTYFELPTDDALNDFFYLTSTTYAPILFGTGDAKAVFYQAKGLITFNADTSGNLYYLNAFSYDLNGAAAEIWDRKVSARTNYIDIKTDNHTLSLDQDYQHCLERYRYYSSRSFKSNNVKFIRIDQGVGYGRPYQH